MELLKELTQAWGVAGREKKIRAIVKREIEGLVDEMYTDAVGNLIALKKGVPSPDNKKIMMAAHMDEIGMQVKKIEGDGRINIRPSGTEALVRVMVEGKNQKKVEEMSAYAVETVKNVVKKLMAEASDY